jgi:hypothetical protein
MARRMGVGNMLKSGVPHAERRFFVPSLRIGEVEGDKEGKSLK